MKTSTFLSAAVLGAVALSATPALAKSDVAEVARQMRDPQMQGAMAAAVRAMSDAMLDMKIAPLLKAAEAIRGPDRARDVDPDARLRDYAGDRAEEMPEQLSRRLPAMMGAMGGMAEAVEEMTPALKDMAKQVGAAVGASMAQAQGGSSEDSGRDDEIPSATED